MYLAKDGNRPLPLWANWDTKCTFCFAQTFDAISILSHSEQKKCTFTFGIPYWDTFKSKVAFFYWFFSKDPYK